MSDQPFDLDADGMVITRPVLGWTIAPVAGMAVLARLNYSETPADIGTGGKALQIVLTPQQALELADLLTKQAKHILAQRPDSGGAH